MDRLRLLLSLAAACLLVGTATPAQSPQDLIPLPSSQTPAPGPIRVQGRHFVDNQGRVVLLRGVNLSGDAKVPPFLPAKGPADLDPLVPFGFNVVRLVFIWEGYEPRRGEYDEGYLAHLRMIAAAAHARGMHVVVDFHQDGFSRYTAKGAGDGFPLWAVSSRGKVSAPDNGPESKNWPVKMFTDPAVRKSFDDFYKDDRGVRSRFLAMVDRVAAAFAGQGGVIGYDLLNEPHGDEVAELAPLYEDMAKVIRARDPDAILFVQGHITTNSGFQTKLPGPPAAGSAYAPHYYNLTTIVMNRWHRSTRPMDKAFEAMVTKAEEWDAPLFLGEFGMGADVAGTTDYMREVYDRMDARLASGAQWNYTPNWDDERKDGWNLEDFNILDRRRGGSSARPNFEPRPYPRATAGVPLAFSYEPPSRRVPVPSLAYSWENDPAKGVTEVFVPEAVFTGSPVIEVFPADVQVWRDPVRQVVFVDSPRPGQVALRVQGEEKMPR
jgi:endoglycosylceramidase